MIDAEIGLLEAVAWFFSFGRVYLDSLAWLVDGLEMVSVSLSLESVKVKRPINKIIRRATILSFFDGERHVEYGFVELWIKINQF